jgi:hypothetical protein
VLKSADPTLGLPKFDVMTVNQVFGVLFRGAVVGTRQADRSNEAPVDDDVGSVFRHRALNFAGPDKEQNSARGSVHFGLFVYSLLGSFAHVAYEQLRELLMIVNRIWQNFSVLK